MPRPAPPPPSEARPAEQHRQVLIRRAVVSGVFILILVLLLLGIRGCLNARKERAFDNYASDLSSVSAENASISEAFFDRLSDPGGISPLEFEAEIQADRAAMAGLQDRAENLDPPDELTGAHREIELAYELRTDALAGFSEAAPSAIGDPGSKEFIADLAQEMEAFAAADVLDARGAEAVLAELEVQGVDPPEDLASRFLPEIPDWLSDDEIKRAVERFAEPDEGTGTTGAQDGRE